MIEPVGAVTGGVADLAMPWSWQVGEVEVNETTTQTESGKNLSRGQHYFLASVATERYGNERGVNVDKQSWYVKLGIQPISDPKHMNDAWLT